MPLPLGDNHSDGRILREGLPVFYGHDVCMVVAPRRACLGCGANTAGAPKRVTCSHPVCGWFTEGFDTADLKSAEALVKELA
jgi:hypothetical protein